MNSRKRVYSVNPIVFYAIFWIVVILLCLARPINKARNLREVTVTVTDKGIKQTSSKNEKYLIYTVNEDDNIQVFEITDSLFKLRYDSSDDYAAIKVDETYTFLVGGSRIKILSWYPNIYEYELVEEDLEE